MKLIKTSLALLAIVAVVAFSVINDPLSIGSSIPNPDLKMKDITGKEVSLSSAMKNNGLLVMFSCNTCPVVKRYQTRTNDICKYALEKGLGVVLLNSNEALRGDGDSFAEMQDYAKKNSYSWHYVVDQNSKMADAFGATRTPEVFLFNSQGKLVYHGAIDDNPQDASSVERKHLKQAIDETLGGKEVSMKKTRSVGCSIKRV